MRTLHDTRSAGRAWLSAIALTLGAVGLARAQAPAPPRAPAPLANFVPAKDLIFYFQCDGLDTNQAAWKASAASKILNQTTFGVLLEDLATQGIDLAAKDPRADLPTGAQVVGMVEQVIRRGFVLALNGTLEEGSLTFTARGGARPEIMGVILKVLNSAPGEQGPPKEIRKGDRKVTLASRGGSVALIEDRGDLTICEAKYLDPTIALLEGKARSVVGHPLVAELGKAEGTFRPVLFGFFDPKALPPLPPDALAMGLGGLERVDFRWGFRDEALYSIFRVKAPAPRKGLLGLLDGPTFDRSSLPPMPASVTGFAALSLAPAALFDKIAFFARKVGDAPNTPDQFAMAEGAFGQMTGVKLKEDLLAKLGPKMAGFAVPATAPGGLPIEVVVLAEVADGKGFAGSLGKVFDVANRAFQGRPGGQPAPEFRKLEGKLAGFELILPEGAIPPGPMTGMRPTIRIGDRYLAIGTMPGGAAQAVDVAEGRGAAWKPTESYVAMADLLPKSLVGLSVTDPRQTLPVMVANLPALLAAANMAMANRPGPGGQAAAGPAIPIEVDPAKIPAAEELSSRLFPSSSSVVVDAEGIRLIGREAFPELASPGTAGVMAALLLPAVQAAREAARRAQCVNNMKQIGLAMHNHESVNGSFPARAIVDKDGKPLLSWRVAILPFVEQQELYNKFKLDEPWDSENNKPLLAEMPRTYLCPTRKNPEAGTTCYCVLTGENTPFATANGPRLSQITDGTSNTLLVVESGTPVPWTKPDDLPFDPESKAPNFGATSNHPGGFNALLMDGSVRFLKNTINQAILKALISPQGGEVINADAY